MLNSGIASSAISLKTRRSLSLTTSNYSSNRRSRFAYSPSTPCCSFCCNSIYTPLLTDDVGEECFLAKKKTRRLVEKRENGNVCRECGSEKNRVDIRPINSSRKERIPSEENEQAILREERVGGEEREKLERELMRKENWKLRPRAEEKEELLSREHKQMVRNEWPRTEKKEELLKRKEHRQKMRKDGSSCSSSYYSFSSNGDYESGDEVELTQGNYLQGSSTGLKSYSTDNEDYREDHVSRFANGNSSTKSDADKYDFRKKSEKRLDDISGEEMEPRKETLVKESKSATTYQCNNEKSLDYVSYDNRKEKSTESMRYDEKRRQQPRQTVAEISRQSETEGQTSFSQKRFETNVKREEDTSTTVRVSIDNAEHQQQYHQVNGQVELKGKSQKLIKKDHKSILKRGTNEAAKQEENVILASTSSLVSEKPYPLVHAKITKSGISRNESDEPNKVIVTHSGNTGVTWVEDRNKNKPETPVRPPPVLEERDAINLGSTSGIAIDDSGKGSLQLESTTLHGSDIQSVAIHPEVYAGAKNEFVKQVRSVILISETQRGKETYKTKILHEESAGDPQSKGPADEMRNVNEPPIEAEVQDNASKDSDVIVKRTGRSLWNIITDIARLRWSHSESHDSGRKTGGRSSSYQSTSSGKWRKEAEENEEALEKIESRSSKKGLSGSHQQGKTGSQIEESASSSNLEGGLRHVGMKAGTSLPTGGEVSGDTSFSAVTDSIYLPALRMQRSPSVQGVLEVGEARTTRMVEQIESVVNKGEAKQKKLQRKDQVVSDRFDEWEEAYRLEAEQLRVDEIFMREALSEAQKAADNWEVPVGAVLVQNGKIIARGCNLVEELRDSTAHAEIICIREASNKLRSWRLSDTTLYLTLEPCSMCAGAILQARIETLVWGTPNKLLGADGSWVRLFPGDGRNDSEVTDKPAAPLHPFHPKMSIRRGVLAPECADAMQHFFKRRRKKDKKAADTSSTPPS